MDSRTWIAGHVLQDMDRRTWIAGHGSQDMDCRTWVAGHGLQDTDCKIRVEDEYNPELNFDFDWEQWTGRHIETR